LSRLKCTPFHCGLDNRAIKTGAAFKRKKDHNGKICEILCVLLVFQHRGTLTLASEEGKKLLD
jgi:hypothetical protein